MPLDLTQYIDQLITQYKPKDQQYLAFLIYGNSGVGKTYSIKTAPRPVLFHSFDPGGWKTLRQEVESHDVLVDSRFESAEDPYTLWDTTFHNLLHGKVFEAFGTYVIDSGTLWAEAILGAMVKRTGAKNPEQRHYRDQQSKIAELFRLFAALPCHFIMTGHIAVDRDETDGKMRNTLMVPGQAKVKLPIRFDEVYCLHADMVGGKVTRYFQIANNGRYEARSRVISLGDIPVLEDASFKTVFKVAGLPFVDKPRLEIGGLGK